MTTVKNDSLPVKHPGLVFKERILNRHNVSVTEAAKKLHISRKQMSLFANGKSDVSVLLAKKLETSTGITAVFWINLQNAYDLHTSFDVEVFAEPLYAF